MSREIVIKMGLQNTLSCNNCPIKSECNRFGDILTENDYPEEELLCDALYRVLRDANLAFNEEYVQGVEIRESKE